MIEPNADIRVLAATMMQMYAGFEQAGFTPDQSLDLVKAMLTAGVGGGNAGENGS